MSAFHQVLIGGYPDGGLMTDRKPLMLPDQAFSNLQNAYVFRYRVKKRDGTILAGRLRRVILNLSEAATSLPGSYTTNLLTSFIANEPDASLEVGSVVVTINPGGGAQTVYKDIDGLGNITPGIMNLISGPITISSGTINYATGVVNLVFSVVVAPLAVNASFNYFPGLPVMGICRQDTSVVGIENTIFFDTRYAYIFTGGAFQELIAGTTWTGSNTDFFWSANYQGATADLRYFFVTNNNIGSGPYDPIRYYDNTNWNNLQPLITATDTLWQALIIVPYYGRLLALNTWEGTTLGGSAGATNFFSRVRFSQIGDPVAADAWRSDIFGKGGFLDAPTNESIVSAAFFRNTLIVFFEYSTWQLRYVGEYGLPFIFERISSDFGCESTFSPILFDQGVMAVGDRGIIEAGVGGVKRLDEQIPETVFSFKIDDEAPNFVHGIRDFEKEVVYWNYLDETEENKFQEYPNSTLLFNYKNNTWAQFRDTITCFGIAQFPLSVTWESLTTFWESNASWDSSDDQDNVDFVTAGNQQGFVSIYENPEGETNIGSNLMFAPSLFISAVDFTAHPTEFTIPSHNLANGEIIYLTGTVWNGTDPAINNVIYRVTVPDINGTNIITLGLWDGDNYAAVDIISSATYLGNGLVTLLPKMNIVTKDFNPYQGKGKQFKLSYIDFQMDATQLFPSIPAVTIQLFINSYLGEQGNLLVGNKELINSSQQANYITDASQANPCVIESVDHSLVTGDVIYIANVLGMTQLNGFNYTITVVDADHFSLDGTDSTGFTVYSSGGIWNTIPQEGQTYPPGAQYAWYSFYSTQFGQYLRIGITYDDALMNQPSTHQVPMELNAMNCWFREGGRITN